jgi:hypothetical protein
VAENFTADARLTGSTVGEDSTRSGEDGDAESVADARHVVLANVGTSAGLGDALEATDDPLVRSVVPKEELDVTLGLLGNVDVSLDEALLLQNLGELKLDV